LLGNRFLCRGGGLLFAAPTGIGKSVLTMQAAIRFALGQDLFGIQPAGKLRVLIVQAENDAGDVQEIRDGIADGLGLSAAERAEAFAAINILTETSATGSQFVALLDKVLGAHPCDLLFLDPLFAYIGDNISDQRACSTFLRNGINPVLAKHGCGLVLVHHVNKPPTGVEKRQWQAGDFAYLGSGSAELANWARAVIGLRSIGSHRVFQFVLGKRGKRAGILNAEGEPAFDFYIKHADAGILWERATTDDMPAPDEGSKASVKASDVASVFNGATLLTYSKLIEALTESHAISDRTAKRAVARAVSDSTIRKTSAGFYERITTRGDK
jgi:hypothetical protein